MPQYDLYHETVRRTLTKDGWTITTDPFVIEFKGLRLYADLGAEKVIADDVYQDFFLRPAIQEIVLDHAISLLVFNPDTEEIIKWISQPTIGISPDSL